MSNPYSETINRVCDTLKDLDDSITSLYLENSEMQSEILRLKLKLEQAYMDNELIKREGYDTTNFT